MQTRLLWRRSATAIGLYGSVAIGLFGGLVAARELHPSRYGLYSLAVFGAGFFQVLLDLTVEEAMIKYGFRYTTIESWGRLRRLYRRSMVLKSAGAAFASVALLIVAPFADELFNGHGLRDPFLLAALLPISFIPEAPAGAARVLDGRYERRAAFNFLTAALRAFSRFPDAPPEPLGDDRKEIVDFVVRSSIGSTIVSIRAAVVPLLLGIVSVPREVGYFRAGQAPQTGLTALTAPARLILITEQTRDWEAGATARVF